MKNLPTLAGLLAPILLGLACSAFAQSSSTTADTDLGGTSWQLVRFHGSDDKILTPDDPSKYTVAFAAAGTVSARIDCNRGHGAWSSAGPNQVQFGPMALTRAMCAPAPLTGKLATDWQFMRSYVIRDGHLFLSLMADGGTYEFGPMPPESASDARGDSRIRGSATYRERIALPAGAVFEAILEDVSRADAPAQVIAGMSSESLGNPPIVFEIPYDASKIDEGHSYSVRARILVAGQLFFTSMQSYPVLTRGNGNEVNVLLQRASSPAATPAADSGLTGLPATFAGTLPCADCPGIDYRLDINPDHTYSSKMTYQERQATLSESGQWDLNGTTLTLHSAQGSTEKFSVRDADTLRGLDMNGQEIVSQHNYDLKRQAGAQQASTVTGGAVAGADSALEGTRWALTKLSDNPVSTDAGPNAPYLQFDASTHRVSGSGGCNRVAGSYTLTGDQLSFSQMAGTMMACIQGMDTEHAFLQALGQVATYKIAGQTLVLSDAAGKSLATLEARPAN